MIVFLALLVLVTVALAVLTAAGVLTLPLWAILLPAIVAVAIVALGVLAVLATLAAGRKTARSLWDDDKRVDWHFDRLSDRH